MQQQSIQKIKSFYDEAIVSFLQKYPALKTESIGLVKVLHAYNNKIPLIQSLLDHDLLSGVVLKRSSSDAHPKIVKQIKSMLTEEGCALSFSAFSPDFFSNTFKKNSFVINDHGGYFSNSLGLLTEHFEGQFLGITDHTLNGELRTQRVINQDGVTIPFFSSAQGNLKKPSDQDIACEIANNILGHEYVSEKSNITIIGYGTMGRNAAQKMRASHNNILIYDIDIMRRREAVQDGFTVVAILDDVVAQSEVIVLATNTISDESPVLNAEQLSHLKINTVLTSMTSIDDEIDRDEFKQHGSHIRLLYDGRSPNTVLENGGANYSICKVEASELVGAFMIANNDIPFSQYPSRIQYQDAQIIENIWQNHFE